MPDAIELLKIRRSVKPREMSGPGPSPSELDTILTIGARVPDHGKLTPWRFIVFEGGARARAGEIIAQVFAKKNPAAPIADIEAEATRLEALGARRVQDDHIHEHGSTWILMNDPEGNEFCVCDGGAPA